MAIQFKKAVRTNVKLKVLVTGASGSGKTYGALGLATSLFPGEVAGIDSENDRMCYYAEVYDFQHLSLDSVLPGSYIAAIDAAVAAGFKIIVIDSLSHCWNDLLDRKNAYERATPGSNGFTLWNKFGREWETLVQYILAAPIHVIATARSKQAYEQTTDEKGKKQVIKLGMEPQVRNGAEYEFAVAFDVNQQHVALCTKDNTTLFGAQDALWNLSDPSVANMLKVWMSTAAPVPTMTDAQRAELAMLLAGPAFNEEERQGAVKGLRTEREADQRLQQVRALLASRTETSPASIS